MEKLLAKYGTLFIDENIESELNLVLHRLSYLKLYCSPEDSNNKEYIRKYNTPVTIIGETGGFYQEANVNYPKGTYFRYIPYLDTNKMREEIDSILQKIESVSKLIYVNESKFRDGAWERGLFK